MRLDHVSYAVSHHELADTVQRLGLQLGGTFEDGGRHPRFGTQNFVLPLEGGVYLEVVSALDHPASDKAPFGQAVKRRAEAGGGWLGWVVAVDEIAPVEERIGRPAVDGHRVRPDGFDLTWKQLGVVDLLDDPSLPYFVQWTCPPEEHPSAAHPAKVSAVACEISGDRERVREWLGGNTISGGGLEAPIEGTDVTWVDGEEPGLVAVHFRTASGDVVRVD
jgi:hypothetical protein